MSRAETRCGFTKVDLELITSDVLGNGVHTRYSKRQGGMSIELMEVRARSPT